MIKEYLREFKFYQNAARSWWDLLDEVKAWRFFVLSSVPGKLGVYLRGRLLVKGFGACGNSPFIERGMKIDNPRRLFIGNDFRSSIDLYISAGGTVKIGNSVLIGPYVRIWSINHNFDRIDVPIVVQGWTKKEVVIEDEVWIGANAIILPGARIGRGTIVSAGSVLSKSVPAYSIVAGNPARIIGNRLNFPRYPSQQGRKEQDCVA